MVPTLSLAPLIEMARLFTLRLTALAAETLPAASVAVTEKL